LGASEPISEEVVAFLNTSEDEAYFQLANGFNLLSTAMEITTSQQAALDENQAAKNQLLSDLTELYAANAEFTGDYINTEIIEDGFVIRLQNKLEQLAELDMERQQILEEINRQRMSGLEEVSAYIERIETKEAYEESLKMILVHTILNYNGQASLASYQSLIEEILAQNENEVGLARRWALNQRLGCGDANTYSQRSINDWDPEEVKSNPELSIYPNPAGTEITLSFPFAFTGKVIVMDLMGRQVLQSGWVKEQSTKHIDTAGLTSGAYFVLTFDPENNLVYKKKLVVKN